MKSNDLISGKPFIQKNQTKYIEKPWEVALMHAAYIIVIIGMIILLIIGWRVYALSTGLCGELLAEESKRLETYNNIINNSNITYSNISYVNYTIKPINFSDDTKSGNS